MTTNNAGEVVIDIPDNAEAMKVIDKAGLAPAAATHVVPPSVSLAVGSIEDEASLNAFLLGAALHDLDEGASVARVPTRKLHDAVG